jgi:hypothetical protein
MRVFFCELDYYTSQNRQQDLEVASTHIALREHQIHMHIDLRTVKSGRQQPIMSITCIPKFVQRCLGQHCQ